jgi:hypothetical protein
MLWHKVQGAGGTVGGGGGGSNSVVNTDFALTTSGQTYTITNANLGTPSANRYIAVVAQNYNTANVEIASITVGGSQTQLQSTGRFSIGGIPGAIGLISYPSGTNADVFVNFGTTSLVRGIIGVYAVYGVTSLFDFDTGGGNSSTGSGIRSYTLNENDIVLSSIYVTNGSGLTLSGLSQDDIAIVSGRYLTINSYGPEPSGGTLNYSWSWTNPSSFRWNSYHLR